MTSIKQIGLLTILAGGMACIYVPGLRAHLPDFITGGTTQGSASTEIDPEFGEPDIGIGSSDGSISTTPSSTAAEQGKGDWLSALRNFKAQQGSPQVKEDILPTGLEEILQVHGASRLREWHSAHPLKAILLSSLGNRALFGSISIQEGAQPFSGCTVEEIATNHVVLRVDGELHQISLPGLGSPTQSSNTAPQLTPRTNPNSTQLTPEAEMFGEDTEITDEEI